MCSMEHIYSLSCYILSMFFLHYCWFNKRNSVNTERLPCVHAWVIESVQIYSYTSLFTFILLCSTCIYYPFKNQRIKQICCSKHAMTSTFSFISMLKSSSAVLVCISIFNKRQQIFRRITPCLENYISASSIKYYCKL